MGSVSIVSVKSGPAGLVVVKVRLESGTVRTMVMPKKTSGVAEIEWSAQAINALAQIKARPT